MKILHVVSAATMTGPADPALELAVSQAELLGHDVHFAYDRVRKGNMADKVAGTGLPVVDTLSLCTKGGLWRALRDRRTLARLADEYDVIHAHASHDHGLVALARGHARVVRSIHHPRGAQRRAFQHVAYDRTDGFVMVARAHRDLLVASYPSIPPERIAVAGGAVDLRRFHPGLCRATLRDEFDIPSDAFVVGMCARFQRGRGQDLLLEAFVRARAAEGLRRPLWLVFIGKGETRREIEPMIKALGVGDRTRVYGFRDGDLPEALASCDATVLLQEGNDAGCRAVLQSLACGVPVIGARYAAVEDALEQGGGLLIDPGDASALEAAIVRLAQLDEAQIAAVRSEARSRATAQHGPAIRAARVDALYRRLMEQPRAR